MNKVTFFCILMLTLLVGCTSPPEDVASATIVEKQDALDVSSLERVEIDIANSQFSFEGYGPGKSHLGNFSTISGAFFMENGQIVGATGTIDAASVDVGIAGLNNHLKTDDFFDVEQYPTITIDSNEILSDETSQNVTITATLNFHGVSHDIAFPAVVSDSSISADFLLDITPFNIKYTGINKDVRITFDFRV